VGVQHGLSDAELIRASAIDPHAFRALYERHFEALHRYFRRRLGREVADDLAGAVLRGLPPGRLRGAQRR
jgi:DNA-directed RNA polymerase specialized sigma24 family protein